MMNKIYTLHDHYDNKTTVVVGEFCINGCQTFHKKHADKVFDSYYVSERHQHDVINLFEEYNPNEPFDLKEFNANYNVYLMYDDRSLYKQVVKLLIKHYYTTDLRDFMFNHKDQTIKKLGARFYSTEQVTQLILHEPADVREALAAVCDKEHLNILVNDKTDSVRVYVAYRELITSLTKPEDAEYIKNCIDKLVDDEAETVRMALAAVGYVDHLDKLVNDPCKWVRRAVAKHGITKHQNVLVNDAFELVRTNVARYGNKEHLDKLVYDECCEVRRVVAKRGFKEHLNILVHDESEDVRRAVARYGYKDHLDILINDESEDVVTEAINTGIKVYELNECNKEWLGFINSQKNNH